MIDVARKTEIHLQTKLKVFITVERFVDSAAGDRIFAGLRNCQRRIGTDLFNFRHVRQRRRSAFDTHLYNIKTCKRALTSNDKNC